MQDQVHVDAVRPGVQTTEMALPGGSLFYWLHQVTLVNHEERILQQHTAPLSISASSLSRSQKLVSCWNSWCARSVPTTQHIIFSETCGRGYDTFCVTIRKEEPLGICEADADVYYSTCLRMPRQHPVNVRLGLLGNDQWIMFAIRFLLTHTLIEKPIWVVMEHAQILSWWRL